MKLQNKSLKYLSISILIIISIWAPLFYYIIKDEIHDSLDKGLTNQKILVIQQKLLDTATAEILEIQGNYFIKEVDESSALAMTDQFKDTTIYPAGSKHAVSMRMLATAFQAGEHYYELKVFSSTLEEDDLIADLFWAMIWLYIVLIISIIAINNLALGRLWRPFYQLLDHFKAFSIEKNEALPDVKTQTTEFSELKKAADEMTRHARAVFNSQKQFTENAAHELQTPLAVLTNKLELLLEKGELDDLTATQLSESLGIVHHLKQLNKSLLLLSKIENKQFIESQNVELAPLCHEVLSNLEPFATFKGIQLDLQQPGTPTIRMNKILAHILISNLIKNAIFHNTQGGKVLIQLNQHNLRISNTGIHDALAASSLFKRFYKGDASPKSTGLGLSIVKAICDTYGFAIHYNYNEQLHHFIINFNNSAI